MKPRRFFDVQTTRQYLFQSKSVPQILLLLLLISIGYMRLFKNSLRKTAKRF